jgi:hypothetical protein
VGLTTSELERNRGRFRKGRAKTGGRRQGTPNRATRAAKDFLADLVNRTDVQEAIRDRILAGDTPAFFRALAHVIGKPREAMDMNVRGDIAHWLLKAREAARRGDLR